MCFQEKCFGLLKTLKVCYLSLDNYRGLNSVSVCVCVWVCGAGRVGGVEVGVRTGSNQLVKNS